MKLDKTEIKIKLKRLIEEERDIIIGNDGQKLDLDSFVITLIILFIKEDIDRLVEYGNA